MDKRILAISASPRPNSNTRILLQTVLQEITRAGHEVEELDLSRLSPPIHPCIGCDACLGGECVQHDSMDLVYPLLDTSDVLVIASPIYFYSLPAQLKALIDRCQLFFNRKYVKKETRRASPGRAYFISCGATKGNKLFDGSILTLRYWLDSFDFTLEDSLLARGLDEQGAVLRNRDLLKAAADFGAKIARTL